MLKKLCLSLGIFFAYTLPVLAEGDLLFLDDGSRLRGTFLSSTLNSIRFQNDQGDASNYAKKKVPLVVLGEKEISFWGGIIPGIAQYQRGQVWKSYIMLPSFVISLTGIGVGIAEWVRLEAALSTKARPDQQFIDDTQKRQRQQVTLIGISGAIFVGVYVWHILDWNWWGDHYDAFLSFAQMPSESEQTRAANVQVRFSYGYDSLLNENVGQNSGQPYYNLTTYVLF